MATDILEIYHVKISILLHNEIKYVKFGLPPGSKCLQPNQLSFQGRKEALAHGVVEIISYGPHGRPDLQRFASTSEAKGRVLRALIHVRDDTFRSTLFGRHIQRIEHQVGFHMSGHCPSHKATADDVENDSEKPEALSIWDIGDVRYPELIQLRSCELPVGQVRGESKQAVRMLKDIGIRHVAMLTGDAQPAAEKMGAQAEVDAVHAQHHRWPISGFPAAQLDFWWGHRHCLLKRLNKKLSSRLLI